MAGGTTAHTTATYAVDNPQTGLSYVCRDLSWDGGVLHVVPGAH